MRWAGWQLVDGGRVRSDQPGYVLLIEACLPYKCLADLVGCERMILPGVENPDERARLVATGFAGALPNSVGLTELSALAERAIALASRVPRRRRVGPATLDLYHRDAQVAGRWVGLFPREFELLWCLADNAGVRMSKRQLLKDVWRLDHDPETNRVEVHISRLRSKLASAGAGELIGNRSDRRLLRPQMSARGASANA